MTYDQELARWKKRHLEKFPEGNLPEQSIEISVDDKPIAHIKTTPQNTAPKKAVQKIIDFHTKGIDKL